MLLSFNRVREICSDEAVLQEVCANSEALELSADRLKVRRAAPWPEHDTSRPRTVLARGVPATATLDQLLTYFATHGPVNAVRFRRNDAKERKDSVFVEFGSDATAAKVAALKQAEFAPGVVFHFHTGQSYWQSKQGKGQKKKNGGAAGAAGAAAGEGESKKRDEKSRLFEPGTIVHFSGIGTGLSRQALKEVFEQHVSVPGSVKFVDYANGATEGFVRLDNEIVASFMMEKMRGSNALVDGKEPALRALETGPEFEAYLQKIAMFNELKSAPANKKHKGGRGKKDKQQGGKKRKEKPASKAAAAAPKAE